ncbi:MAG: TrbI/VirB10 family protein [Amaricoccus sp.]|uniref:TrbI/VirB10 family protein n=1 Tax=Amaricoccus sp. TaxID=1872485 RepID=UPI0039E55DF7
MRLRAEPPRVTRLLRRVLAGLGLAASIGVGASLIYALQAPHREGGGPEFYSTENRTRADGLAGLPRDYTGPVLGPPLPGDLGEPILNAQARPPAALAPQVDPAEQRRLAEEEAARVSKVFFATGPTGGMSAGATSGVGLGFGGAGSAAGGGASMQGSQAAFLDGPVDRRTVAPNRIAAPASPYLLQAGAVIPAALIIGIRSDLPGQVVAQVTESVYDSPTGQILLIPQGARLIGEYSSDVGFGQRRVLLVWNRLIYPDGSSIVLERLPGADPRGYAGLEDGVDYHWRNLAAAAALSALLGAGAELATDDGDRLTRALRDGAPDTINDAGQQIVRRQLDVKPTLTIRPGFPLRVIVTRDLVRGPAQG